MLMASAPVAIVARSDLNIRSIRDLVGYAKRNPQKISFGTPGTGSPMHLLGESINQEAGIAMNHVPYKGSPQAMSDLIGGNLEIVISTLSAIKPYLAQNKLSLVALAEDQPFSGAAEVPLVMDTIPGVVAPGWFAIMARKGTPRDVIDKLHHAAMLALGKDEVRKGMEALAMVPAAGDAKILAEKIRGEYDYFGKVVKVRNIPRN